MSARSKLYPIQVVARRTGLNVDVLRAWERRYSVVEPERSEGGRRLYSAADIDRLSLLGRAVDRGLRIGDARRMDDAALRAFLAEHAAPAGADGSGTDAPVSAAKKRATGARATRGVEPAGDAKRPTDFPPEAAHLAACKQAVQSFDSVALERTLARAKVSLSLRALIDGVIAPLLVWIGERWSEGSLCVAQEHMASAVARSTLLPEVMAGAADSDAPRVVITTPVLELHELGAVLAALAAISAGWRVEYLGPNLPAAEIAVAARRCGARAVALSLARPVKDASIVAELKELRKLLPKRTAMFAGGKGALAYRETIEAVGALSFDDCWSFGRHLESKGKTQQ